MGGIGLLPSPLSIPNLWIPIEQSANPCRSEFRGEIRGPSQYESYTAVRAKRNTHFSSVSSGLGRWTKGMKERHGRSWSPEEEQKAGMPIANLADLLQRSNQSIQLR
jgi:hypothetical protein